MTGARPSSATPLPDESAGPGSPASADSSHRGAIPTNPRDGLAPVAVTSEFEAQHFVSDAVGRTIVRVALPSVASALLMTLFASVDAYWVGTRLGPAPLAAVSASLFWIWMLISLGEMFGVGLTAVAARRRGERAHRAAAQVGGDAVIAALALGVVVGVVGRLGVPQVFALMNTPPEVTAQGMRYLGTYFLGTPLVFGYIALDAAFRSAGDTRTPFAILAISVAITLVLDPMLIMGMGGAPKLGVMGAAIATVVTRGAAFVIAVGIAAERRIIRFGKVSIGNVLAVCRVGLPTAITGVFFSLIYVPITRIITRFGTPAIAALGIGHRVESWVYTVGVGVGAATAAIVGQNLGAGRVDRASRAGWLAVAMCTAVGLVAFGYALLFAPHLAGLFSRDATVIAEGASYLRIAAIAQLGVCAEVVLEAALGGAGETVPPMLSSTTLTAARIPLAALAAPRWGIIGVWWVITLTAVGRALAMVVLWRWGRWKRRVV